MNPWILGTLALAVGCNEYDFGSDAIGDLPTADGTQGSAPADTAVPTDPGGETASDDTSTAQVDRCYEPAFGYETNPAARLVITDAGTPVTITYLGADSAYTDELWLDVPTSQFLAVAGDTAVGAATSEGPFPVDTELVFGLQVRNTGDHFESGPSDRNGDATAHVAVTYEGNCSWVIGFEDLWGGGDRDYNDTELRITGLLRQE